MPKRPASSATPQQRRGCKRARMLAMADSDSAHPCCCRTEPSHMERLPDEVLLHVLSLVADAETLIDAVPLVCRRWRALSRERAVWRHVDLDCRRRPHDARALLRAPALRSLALRPGAPSAGRWWSSPEKLEVQWSTRALLRSAVGGLRVLDASVEGVSMRTDVAPLFGAALGRALRRNRDSLRTLTLGLDDELLAEAVAELRGLQRLDVSVDGVGLGWYRGQLGGGALPALKSLRFRYRPRDDEEAARGRAAIQAGEATDASALFDDVLRGAAESLESVAFDLADGGGVADRSALLALRRLRRVMLCVSANGVDYEADEPWREATRALESTLQLLGRVPSLQCLCFEVDCTVPPEELEVWESRLQAFGRLMNDLGVQASEGSNE